MDPREGPGERKSCSAMGDAPAAAPKTSLRFSGSTCREDIETPLDMGPPWGRRVLGWIQVGAVWEAVDGDMLATRVYVKKCINIFRQHKKWKILFY